MKIFTEILKATPINFIESYFSFIVQTNLISLNKLKLQCLINYYDRCYMIHSAVHCSSVLQF